MKRLKHFFFLTLFRFDFPWTVLSCFSFGTGWSTRNQIAHLQKLIWWNFRLTDMSASFCNSSMDTDFITSHGHFYSNKLLLQHAGPDQHEHRRHTILYRIFVHIILISIFAYDNQNRRQCRNYFLYHLIFLIGYLIASEFYNILNTFAYQIKNHVNDSRYVFQVRLNRL